jgi:glycerol-3-phosphate acyltransferase PlsY
MDSSFLQVVVLFLICYVIGSIPTAYLIGRLHKINIFDIGSGNMGATNVIRSLGWKWGALVMLIDVLKGVAAVLLAWFMPGSSLANGAIGAIGAVVGHNWSLIATLITGTIKGGKGAATAAGTWFVMMSPWPQILAVTVVAWAAVVLFTRYMSLAVLVSVGLAAGWVMLLIAQGSAGIPAIYSAYVLPIAALVFYRHRENIQRLLAGKERRLGDRVKA